ncbi:MAG: hypothetical protein ABEI86_01040 [Halobacteriaceae archaeon]
MNVISFVGNAIVGGLIYRRPETKPANNIQNPNTVIQQVENVNLLDKSSDNVLFEDDKDDI